jgi:DNA-binding CsgD family transcriptional regulator
VADAAAGLLERDGELAAIRRLLDQAVGGAGALLVVEGPAGAGKTRLIDAGADAGAATGIAVLRASGSELERELGFGVVRSLFERVLLQAGAARRRSLLSGAAGLAAPVVLPSAAAGGEAAKPAAVLHGLFWLCSNLAEREPLMILVDDVHWADAPSLRFLAYLARRLSGLPILVAVAMRSHEPGTDHELLAALSQDPAASVLSPAPLSAAAVRRLVVERFASDPADEFVSACHAASGGNPFLLGELLAALLSDRVAPTADDAVGVGQIGPQTVSRVVLARVSRVGGGARRLAETVAVLGGRGELRHATALAGLDQAAAARAADRLAQIEVLRATRPLEFVHPLVRAAVYDAIGPGQRSLMHKSAARLLAAEGAGPDRVGLHLLDAEPSGEQWVVEVLRAAAAAASGTGAPEQAAGYLRRALREPPAASERAGVLHELGAAELLARDPAATNHLAEALEGTDDSGARGEVALLLGRAAVSAGRLADAWQLLGPVIEQLAEAQPGVVARLEACRAAAGVWNLPRYGAELESDLPRLRALAERAGPPGRSLLLMLAFRSTAEGRPHDEILALVERGLDQGRLMEAESAEAIEVTWAARVLTFIDELDRADRLLEEMVADARKRGSVMGYAIAVAWRAAVELRRGLVAAADADARAAVELIIAHGLHFIAPHTYSFLGEALIEQGELDQAATLLGHAELGPMHGSGPEARFLHTRARVSLARGDKQAAIADLRACESQNRWFRNPNAMPFRSTLALALAPSAHEEALELVDLELEQARRVGQARAIGVALRVRGLLCKGEEQISLLTQAVTALETCPSKLEQAHALTDLGAALRRASRRSEAKELLARALDLAAGCGARALAARTREELVAAGARPRRERLTGVEALTASERRVAQMAATGMTNREIAQALFVTMKAVALHLTHVYEKLDIAGRAQLPRALGAINSTQT